MEKERLQAEMAVDEQSAARWATTAGPQWDAPGNGSKSWVFLR